LGELVVFCGFLLFFGFLVSLFSLLCFWLFERWVYFLYVVNLGLVGVVLERFVARVMRDGKVTIPKRLRELLGVEDGDYVRLGLLEVVEVVG